MSDLFRKEQKPLSPEQAAQVLAIKEKAEELLSVIDTPTEGGFSEKNRYIALAKTSLEQTVMWAVKAHTL